MGKSASHLGTHRTVAGMLARGGDLETDRIKFGTDGWRGIIADDYTFDNVRACAQGVAAYHHAQGLQAEPITVGYDTRFASAEFAAAAAEVLAGNGLRVILTTSPTPTPVCSFTLVDQGAAGGIIITASHNPPQWNGFKYRTRYGGSPPGEVIAAVEAEVARVRGPQDLRQLPMEAARAQGLVTDVEPSGAYLERLASLVDLEALRGAGWGIVVDAMHGAGGGYLRRLLRGGTTQAREMRARPNPAFPGMHNPEPVAHNLRGLSRAVARSGARAGLALDGDADRLGAVDASGRYLTTLQVFSLLAYYFLEVRGLRGPIVKSVTTSSMIWRLGEAYDVPVRETGVGFKQIAPVMLETDALLGGEESGGYAFRGHIPERDGILSGLFLLDLMARTGKGLAELLEDLYRLVGPHHFDRHDIPFDAARREAVVERVSAARPERLAGLAVTSIDTLDGFRFHLEGGSWAIVRFSGTEPLLRIYAEAPAPGVVQALLAATRDVAGV